MSEVKKIHFIGVLGSGISYAACLAKLSNFEVSGCDMASESEYKRQLEDQDVPLFSDASVNHLEGVDLVVISPAVKSLNPDHPELLHAQTKGIPVLSWQEFVGKYLMKDKLVLAVAGTHGKGTTTSLVGLLLEAMGVDPTVGLGAIVPKWGTNYRFGKSDYFVVEADEFNDNFLHFQPNAAAITTLEMDHPEYFADLDVMMKSFSRFVVPLQSLGSLLVLNQENVLSHELASSFSTKANIKWFSFIDPTSDWYGYDLEVNEAGISFQLSAHDRDLGIFQTLVYGRHNAYNVLCALALVFSLLDPTAERIAKSREVLSTFQGAKRRFEILKRSDGLIVIDDYAHHPTAVLETLKTARLLYPQKTIWAVFQPHMFTRTKYLFDEFVAAFQESPVDHLLVTDIYASREKDPQSVSSKDLVLKVGLKHVEYKGALDEVTLHLKQRVKTSDVVVIMGAGDVNRVTKELLNG